MTNRWVEGTGFVLGPLLLLAGTLMRAGQGDFFPAQLAAFADEPGRMELSYGLFAAGNVLLCPAVLGLTRRIGTSHASLAAWAAVLVVLGLFGRTFHAGVSHLAFQAVDVQGVESAQRFVADSYGAFHVFKAANLPIMVGWLLLALGAYRAKAFGTGAWADARCLLLALMAAVPLGVLKGGTSPLALAALTGLCLAFIPTGIADLATSPRPRPLTIALVLAAIPTCIVFGTLG